jgi:ABC-type amino acid transport substrate-binding protein
LALLGLGLVLVACSTFSTRQAPPGLERLVETGELRVGMSGEQPPLNMTTRDGELVGLEVALVRVLAKSMRVEARLVRLPFGELLDALENGDVDLVMSGMTITPQRSTRATFVGPYYTSGKRFLARSERLASITEPEELDSPDLRVVVLQGSTSEAFVRETLPQVKLILVRTLEEGIRKVRADEAEVLVADRDTCDFAVLRYPEAGLIAAPVSFTVEPMGIAVRRDEPELAALIENYLVALRDSGALERATRFWFGDPSWVKDLR